MEKEKIIQIYNKHFNGLGEYFDNKVIKNEEKLLDDFYRAPLSNNDLISGTIFNTCNIRYGDFLEEVINEFLIENGAIILEDDKKEGNYDLLFKIKDKLYVGEVKIRDNHDSTKKKGQIVNLIEKATIQKEKNENLFVVAFFFFIDPNEIKNGKFYLKELEAVVKGNKFNQGKIFYGDEIFIELGLTDKWNDLKNDISNLNASLKKNNHIFKTIDDYLKEKYDEKRYNEIIKKINFSK